MSFYINVILPLPLENQFTYAVEPEEAEFLRPGMRVAVPFGKTKIYTGIVAKIHQDSPQVYEAKPIEQILDELPVVTMFQLEFWQWISKYYMCATGEVLKAALPGAFLLESETLIQLSGEKDISEEILTDQEYLIYEALQRQSSLKIHEVIQLLDKKTVLPVINSMVAKNIVVINQEIFEQYKPKLIRYVRLNKKFDAEKEMHSLLDELSRAPKQRDVILSLFQIQAQNKKPIQIKELSSASGASAAIIKSLIAKNVLEEYHLKTDRVKFEIGETDQSLILNEWQQAAFEEVNSGFANKEICLLHGVTSSGKTEIYIKLIEQVIAQGKQVLYLLPEIALTSQLVERLQSFFGEQVLVYHSKYSVNERMEVYKHVLSGDTKAKIILGARSSIFLPFQDLGLIVVDEEHETTFKQFDPAPRYNARDASIVLANMHKANVVMGSATPSLESYFNATHNKYKLISLNRRFGNVQLPDIEIVDIKEKYKKKRMTGHFSDRLLEEIKITLEEGEQVILFQNRRGYSPILECLTCGHSPQCPNCDVSLTYHNNSNQLRCHYCGYHIAMQKKCMACDSLEITTKGFGTEQIETELKALLPEARIGRMDLDTTRGKHGHQKIISAFEQESIDVLVGTQMLSKGLDFRKVRLVGIMNADNLLNFPDFRAHERSFQLMLQVAGRAGRTKARGKVLVQTYNPHHQIVKQVSENNYFEMYKEQLEERYQYKYPPYYKLIKFTLKSRDYSKTNEAADWLAQGLSTIFKQHVLGPEFPPVARIRNEYYKNILLKIPPNQSLGKTKQYINKVLGSFRSVGVWRSVRVIINVDPY
ncbi:primosomal protein N' [Gillisia sp. M10.2A]|uniref:Replication restart protein PriA n=1 Tax=Gillisia lutea TaxID=2909668 RepID=A0ABS9EIU2_9FLAO|nr:primosomal protein N' [Gillisia lutea]MCF4102782.1 primosomal protein N' [Gillisia lutea]